jgi:hypothetical protein
MAALSKIAYGNPEIEAEMLRELSRSIKEIG